METSLARVTVEIVVLSTSLALLALMTVPIIFRCVIVVVEANVAKVLAERDLALLANLRWWLHERAVVARDLLNFFGIKIMWYPRRRIISIVPNFLLDCLGSADLRGSGSIRGLRRLHYGMLLVVVAHIVAQFARVESLAVLALDPALALVV